jgi:uncharacterized protein (AIM24 family)
MDVDQFVDDNAPDEGGDTFQLESGKLLDIDLDGSVMAKAGSMIAYDGDVTFTGKSSAEGGISGFIKEAVTSEGTPVMQAEGQGHVYLADQGKRIQVLTLDNGESVSVNGNDILAFESRVDYEIGTIGSLSGSQAAGFTNVYLTGPGDIAITTHGEPLVLEPPVRTDPQATVAWSGHISPGSHVDNNLKDMVGQQSGETYQLDFTGSDGFVIVQPYEETITQQA